jgi:uncharacterized membrane protein YgcG
MYRNYTQALYRILFIAFFSLFVSASFAQNDGERILNFHSDIVIDSTGRVEVTEHIKVYANGSSIKRGIVRNIPTYREDVNGKKVKVDIRVISVLRDGTSESYNELISNGDHVIRVGNKDHMLSPGEYEYVITYESYGHVGFFDDYDELYWNVTGNDWDFMIEAASATVTLPDESHPINTACYTGHRGSTNKDCTYSSDGDIVSFQSEYALSRGEGFTVAVSFPRDIVKRPPPPSKAELLYEQYKKIGFMILSVLVIGLFYLVTWVRVGRDPKKQLVVPAFNPPNGWSPAVVRYIYKRKYDNKAFTASILSMAVKRSIVISKEKKKYSLARTNNTKKLSREERNIYSSLFSRYATLTVSNKYHDTFSKAFRKLRDYLTTEWNIKEYFKKNIGYTVLAAILTVVCIVIYAVITNSGGLFVFLFTSVFTVFGLVFVVAGLKTNSGCSKIFMIIFGLAFSVPPLIAGLSSIVIADLFSGIFVILLLTGFFLYMYLIKAPTQLGAQAQADLEGFRMYLKAAEEDRLNLLMPPELTPELFEAMLPYAVALDVENEWSEKFDEVLAKYNYSPEWYSGNLNNFTYATFAGSLSSSFTSSFASAKVDPSSSSSSSSGSSSWSSGSSGGGFSGGGGGGGGGGGW